MAWKRLISFRALEYKYFTGAEIFKEHPKAPRGAVPNEGGEERRGRQAASHLFPLLKMGMCCIFLHHKLTQNIDLCLLLGSRCLASATAAPHRAASRVAAGGNGPGPGPGATPGPGTARGEREPSPCSALPLSPRF